MPPPPHEPCFCHHAQFMPATWQQSVCLWPENRSRMYTVVLCVSVWIPPSTRALCDSNSSLSEPPAAFSRLMTEGPVLLHFSRLIFCGLCCTCFLLHEKLILRITLQHVKCVYLAGIKGVQNEHCGASVRRAQTCGPLRSAEEIVLTLRPLSCNGQLITDVG